MLIIHTYFEAEAVGYKSAENEKLMLNKYDKLIGRNLRLIRKRVKLPAELVSQMMGITAARLYRIERGEGHLPADAWWLFCGRLGISTDVIGYNNIPEWVLGQCMETAKKLIKEHTRNESVVRLRSTR